tara:strand:+ start:1674 stop:1787 length:114 start_codon:yes stop_codon:yes gene_type:complete
VHERNFRATFRNGEDFIPCASDLTIASAASHGTRSSE